MGNKLVEAKRTDAPRDPEEKLELREDLRERLALQRAAVARGERGESFDNLVRRLGLS